MCSIAALKNGSKQDDKAYVILAYLQLRGDGMPSKCWRDPYLYTKHTGMPGDDDIHDKNVPKVWNDRNFFDS